MQRIDAGVVPPLYYLCDILGKSVKWTFYKENLKKVDEQNLTSYFQIEDIIDKRRSEAGEEEFLVTFKGQTRNFLRWIPKTDMVE